MAAVLAEVQDLRRELAELREALARRTEENKDEDSEELLAAISYEIGNVEFSCASLIEHAQLDDAENLRVAFEKFFGRSLGPKRLGKWLSKMRKRGTVGRYAVEHEQDDAHRGGAWRISRI